MLLAWILLASLLMACDGDTTPTPRPPIILSMTPLKKGGQLPNFM